MLRTAKILAVTFVLSIASASCDKSGADDTAVAPPAPAMPQAWKVKADQTFDHNQREFLETEGRLEGKIKSLRVTTYEVGGHLVRLNTITPTSSMEGDKIYRILGNKKKPYAYLRKNEIIYEFLGPTEASEEIKAAREMLAR